MEAGALHPKAAAIPTIVGRSPLLRLQGDERLIALIRRGQHGAFEVLVQRYQSRLLSFCRHMLGSTEDAEDVLQEVFAAAFNAICADERPINARPWLYRIARNRCLNHLRRPVSNGQDSMDVFERDGGQSTADAVHKREEFRQIVADVQDLPETQRTALLLREMDALSYEHIAEAMDTTVPSVKSLLVRARVSLAEAAEARLLTCEEVRIELGEVAEGLMKTTAPVRRHLKGCERCRTFRRELQRTNRALAAVYPIGLGVVLKKTLLAKLGAGASGGSSAAGSAGFAGGAAAGGAGSAGGFVSAGLSALATKAVAGVAAAALVTAGAVEVHQSTASDHSHHARASASDSPPFVLASEPQPHHAGAGHHGSSSGGAPSDAQGHQSQAKPQDVKAAAQASAPPKAATAPVTQAVAATRPAATSSATQPPASPPPSDSRPANQSDGSTVTLPPDGGQSGAGSGSGSPPPSSPNGGQTQQPSGSSSPNGSTVGGG